MANTDRAETQPRKPGIIEIRGGGFKSLADPYQLAVRPLTILAGANSSGKSSALQPVLLLKQTLEAAYDPGPLLLHGPHVRITSPEQILSSVDGRTAEGFHAGIRVGAPKPASFVSYFERKGSNKFQLRRTEYSNPLVSSFALQPGWDSAAILGHNKDSHSIPRHLSDTRQQRFFLVADRLDVPLPDAALDWLGSGNLSRAITAIIHVPGLRGNPARSYSTAAVGEMFPGTFETYTASVIHSWQEEDDPRLHQLSAELLALGLTSAVATQQIDATKVEVRVGRLPVAGGDLVNVADVGFGVSQTLPVVVALLAAQPNQLVYLEQPEIHLHPRAQVALASVLAAAARRGVRVVAETHSALLLLGVQTLVASGELPASEVLLYWFERRADGATEIRCAELDEAGSFGDWPEDFGQVALTAESRYLDAVDARKGI